MPNFRAGSGEKGKKAPPGQAPGSWSIGAFLMKLPFGKLRGMLHKAIDNEPAKQYNRAQNETHFNMTEGVS